ncbi:MAG: hypothetical protein HY001_04650 [Candidatus Portnoybacteria bacterium]|nr:hypothetical protein [Candidatus Portnoybacteria bacterium]
MLPSWKNRLLFVLGGFLLAVPLLAAALQSPWAVTIPSITLDFDPLVKTVTAPYRFLAFVKERIDEQGEGLSQKTITLLRVPYTLTKALKERIDEMPQQLASLLSAKENSKSHFARKGSAAEAELTNYKQIPNPNDQISKPVIASPEGAKQYPTMEVEPPYIVRKEIVREVIVREQSPINNSTNSNIPDISDKLAALKTELDDSLRTRINALSGKFGFTSNRFDELTAQKGITAGSGNIKIIGSSGKIPALSLAYFETVPNIFSSIANASSTVQFTASGLEDKLSFEGSGGITISFDSTNKKITFSSVSPTLLNVLQQGADASTFTGQTKISGLTIDSSGFLILPNGTSTTPSLAFSNLTTTGLFAKTGDILWASHS